jgi:hypothetical protein
MNGVYLNYKKHKIIIIKHLHVEIVNNLLAIIELILSMF